jgi:hypothetical protein
MSRRAASLQPGDDRRGAQAMELRAIAITFAITVAGCGPEPEEPKADGHCLEETEGCCCSCLLVEGYQPPPAENENCLGFLADHPELVRDDTGACDGICGGS